MLRVGGAPTPSRAQGPCKGTRGAVFIGAIRLRDGGGGPWAEKSRRRWTPQSRRRRAGGGRFRRRRFRCRVLPMSTRQRLAWSEVEEGAEVVEEVKIPALSMLWIL